MSFLPKEKIKATADSPEVLIIYGPPKVGKTTLLSLLPNNLILDFENGAKFLDRLSVNIVGWSPPAKETEADKNKRRLEDKLFYVTEVGEEIIKNNKPYDFVSIDNVTILEEMVLPLALKKYKDTPMGSNFTGNDVRKLPNGAGYMYLREAFSEAISKIKKLAPYIILVAHLKDTVINKQGKEVSAKDIELTGKIKFTTCADADAVGYLYRGPEKSLMISFKGSEEVICGSRCSHLRGKDIKIAEELENDNVVSYWEEIFTFLK